MSGREYLEEIKKELEAGRRQRRMGENILGAFGYVRRRATAIDEINATLNELGLVAAPPISSQMPLRAPRIRFDLASGEVLPPGVIEVTPKGEVTDTELDAEAADEEEVVGEVLTPSFRISELASANRPVEWISPDASIQQAYTKMALNKYSQLVVAGSGAPRRQDIKGITSYQSIAKALLNGDPRNVRDCLDNDVPIVYGNADLKDVVPTLGEHDVVLVVGNDHRLQGIVTSWDLAEEFAQLVDPFKRIGEIEERLRTLAGRRLGKEQIAQFLSEHSSEHGNYGGQPGELTIGELQRVLEYPSHWVSLGLNALDRGAFIAALDMIRGFRNRLMHFKDPLSADETANLTNFCDLVREIPL